MNFSIEPIAMIHASRAEARDDEWGGSVATIELAASMPDAALDGIETFSHAEVLFVFNRVADDRVVRDARHPRNNADWPRVGVLAQRGKNRPNRIGSTIVRILGREGRSLKVAELDAIDGTPVIDIKPVMREFLPRGTIDQPDWATDLMRNYWKQAD